MKLACLGDIHSNFTAFEACLTYLEGRSFDGVLITGDLVSDCPYPQKTMQLLRQAQSRHPVWCVRGNREEYLLAHHDHPDEKWQDSSQFGSLLYTYENLSDTDLSCFADLPLFLDLQFDCWPRIRLCHGSPSNTREMLLGHDQNSRQVMAYLPAEALVCGHTHDPFHRLISGKHLIKAGSVGIPVNGQTKAQFTSLQSRGGEFKSRIISIDYDRKPLLASFAESGLAAKAPIWSLAVCRLLQTGRNYPLECLQLAQKKAQLHSAGNTGDVIEEKYWFQAARDLGLFKTEGSF